MTTFFDEFDSSLRAVDVTATAAWDVLYLLDQQLVRAVSLVAVFPPLPASNGGDALPGCPAWASRAIHITVLRYSLAATRGSSPAPDYEDDGAYRVGLLSMCAELHNTFHRLARDPAWVYGDGPEAPLRELEGRAGEARQALVDELRKVQETAHGDLARPR